MLDRDKVSHPMEVLRSVIFLIELIVFWSTVTIETDTQFRKILVEEELVFI